MRSEHPKSIILLLFASFVLLAHSILPHYHHDQVICFINEQVSDLCHLEKNTSLDNNQINSCNVTHSVHHHDNSSSCDLKSTVVRHDNGQEYSILETISLLPTFYILFSLNVFYLEMPVFYLHHSFKPYLINYVPPIIGTNLSLRGPPYIFFN